MDKVEDRMTIHTNEYWDARYRKGDTRWDIGEVSPPLKTYFDQLVHDKDKKILIPGCGRAYEAVYLMKNGFRDVFILDWSKQALDMVKKRFPRIPDSHLICDDFFNHQAKYDLIIEQTFFCSLNPELRTKYVEKMQQLLKKDGKLIGLLFDDPLFDNHPPYGGNEKEYRTVFSTCFEIVKMEACNNSIEPRQGRELFIILKPKPRC